MENPTNKGRASCGRFPDATHKPFTVNALRIQHLAARYALPIETAAIIAALAFGGAAHG
jgi:hypothetical protein